MAYTLAGFCIKDLVQYSITLILTVIMLALSGCGNQLVDDGSGFLKLSSGQLVAWPNGKEVEFETDDSVPTDLREQIQLGQEALNEQLGRVQVSVQLQQSNAPKIKKSKDDVIGDGKNGIYFLAEPWPWAKVKGKEESGAMTVVINRGAKIVEADIFYRSSIYSEKYSLAGQKTSNVSVETTPIVSATSDGIRTFVIDEAADQFVADHDERWTKVAFIHECMHALGFTHRLPERDSIMYPSISTGLYDNPFSDKDILRLRKLY